MTPGTDLGERFRALSGFLNDHRHLWAPRPFMEQPVAWEAEHPQVARWLRSLDHPAIDAHEANLEAHADAPPEFRAWADRARELAALSQLPTAAVPELAAPRLGHRVRGRKWAQIEAFVGAARAGIPKAATRLVDWCAGKGHLGRTLSLMTDLPATLLEWRPELSEAGAELSEARGASCQHLTADVMSDAARLHLGPDAAGVGLHACGSLGDALLQASVESDAAAVFLAPCCHHKAADAHKRYHPRSELGRRLDVDLRDGLLRLPTAEEAVARQSHRRSRRRQMAFRLGLDLLIREATGNDVYVPLGTIRRSAFGVPFEEFARATSEARGEPLPERFDLEAAERAGWERARVARGLALVRGLFRRPLEVWLVLDRALWLRERGRQVQVGTFCDAALTPRNIALVSIRS